MTKVDFTDLLPVELILLIATHLPGSALPSCLRSSRRLHEILQYELGKRVIKELGADTLRRVSQHSRLAPLLKQLLAPPYSLDPNWKSITWPFTGETPLHRAAQDNNLEGARILISAGADLEAECGHLGMVELLLDAGADVNASLGPRASPDTALYLALYITYLPYAVEMIDLLLARGAALEHPGRDGTPLACALHCNPLIAKELLLRGADPAADVPLRHHSNRMPARGPLLFRLLELPNPSPQRMARWKHWRAPHPDRLVRSISLLMTYGACPMPTLRFVEAHLPVLAEAAGYTEGVAEDEMERQRATREDGEKELLKAVRQLLQDAQEGRAALPSPT
ncbi:hypothetical protein MIND_00383400 [Mycena indigotica]|uniref:Ankyrin n=1 Tax=Mycena indigotica TaxID=2126181 RepID=A0A8H6T2Z5_9AGAR|nr:uncharacterized protein MIND_00383400 [Mycena indigotica]KAF7310101.1 hypothetical protein MIND_00383400 [Mycena indigotica]